MLTLGKIERHADNQRFDPDTMATDMQSVYRSSGLQAMLKAEKCFTGYLTAEPTPGNLNYNPSRKLAAVRYYKHDTHTRNGFYVKLRIMPTGELLPV